MPHITNRCRTQGLSASVFLLASIFLYVHPPLGSVSLANPPFSDPDVGPSGVLPIYLITPAGGEGLGEYRAKALGQKLAEKCLVAIPERVRFVNKDYFSFTDKDCEAPDRLCEVVQITVSSAQFSRVTYGIDNQLLPHAPDRQIWSERDPLSCDISDAHPATECEDHMLHVLANKLKFHDETAHRQPQ